MKPVSVAERRGMRTCRYGRQLFIETLHLPQWRRECGTIKPEFYETDSAKNGFIMPCSLTKPCPQALGRTVLTLGIRPIKVRRLDSQPKNLRSPVEAAYSIISTSYVIDMQI